MGLGTWQQPRWWFCYFILLKTVLSGRIVSKDRWSLLSKGCFAGLVVWHSVKPGIFTSVIILHDNAHPHVVHAVHDPAGHVLVSAGPPRLAQIFYWATYVCSPSSRMYWEARFWVGWRSQKHSVAVVTTAGRGVLCRDVSVSIGTPLYPLQIFQNVQATEISGKRNCINHVHSEIMKLLLFQFMNLSLLLKPLKIKMCTKSQFFHVLYVFETWPLAKVD